MKTLVDLWLRRAWQKDPTAIAALKGTHPVTLVTGASVGIGRALATECARRSDRILLLARDATELEETAAQITAKSPQADVAIIPLDLTDPSLLDRLDDWLAENDGYVDLLVNNAGIGLAGDFADHDPLQLDRLIALNVHAATRLMRHVLPAMLIRGRGGIINIASMGGLVPGPYQAAYYASKAYLVSLTRAVAWEIRGRGVRLCVIAPGPVETRFHARMGADQALYRYVLPAIGADRVAKSALFGYDFGRTLVVPGVLPNVLAPFVRILPAILLIPLLAVLLRPRGQSATERRNA
jgi:short-subunit dehydrogenase